VLLVDLICSFAAMASSRLFQCLCTAMVFVRPAWAQQEWENKVDEEGRQVQALKIQAPAMTEEDQYGYNMPEQYKCDSCKVVAYHITQALKQKQPKNRRLKSWEYTELFDETCKTGFKGYGVSLVDGQNVLSGPALKRDDVKAGEGAIQMGGETWEKRLGEICRKFIYEKIGEDEVYDKFRSAGMVSSDLCFSETRDCRLGPKPPQGVAEGKKTSQGKTAKKEKKAKQDQKPEEMEVSTFISKLAKQHGVATTEYNKKRSFAEWQQLVVEIARRISDSEWQQLEGGIARKKEDGQSVEV